MRQMTKEELESEVQRGISRRLQIGLSRVKVTVFTYGTDLVGMDLVGIDVKIDDIDGTKEQKALITRYLQDTIDPGVYEAPTC